MVADSPGVFLARLRHAMHAFSEMRILFAAVADGAIAAIAACLRAANVREFGRWARRGVRGWGASTLAAGVFESDGCGPTESGGARVMHSPPHERTYFLRYSYAGCGATQRGVGPCARPVHTAVALTRGVRPCRSAGAVARIGGAHHAGLALLLVEDQHPLPLHQLIRLARQPAGRHGRELLAADVAADSKAGERRGQRGEIRCRLDGLTTGP